MKARGSPLTIPSQHGNAQISQNKVATVLEVIEGLRELLQPRAGENMLNIR